MSAEKEERKRREREIPMGVRFNERKDSNPRQGVR